MLDIGICTSVSAEPDKINQFATNGQKTKTRTKWKKRNCETFDHLLETNTMLLANNVISCILFCRKYEKRTLSPPHAQPQLLVHRIGHNKIESRHIKLLFRLIFVWWYIGILMSSSSSCCCFDIRSSAPIPVLWASIDLCYYVSTYFPLHFRYWVFQGMRVRTRDHIRLCLSSSENRQIRYSSPCSCTLRGQVPTYFGVLITRATSFCGHILWILPFFSILVSGVVSCHQRM